MTCAASGSTLARTLLEHFGLEPANVSGITLTCNAQLPARLDVRYVVLAATATGLAEKLVSYRITERLTA